MPLIIVVTGAAGVGKSTLVRALEAQNLPGVRCYYFDAVSVPCPAQLDEDRLWVARFGETRVLVR